MFSNFNKLGISILLAFLFMLTGIGFSSHDVPNPVESISKFSFVPEGIADEVFEKAGYEIAIYYTEDGEISKKGWKVPRQVARKYRKEILEKSDSIALPNGGRLTAIVGTIYIRDAADLERDRQEELAAIKEMKGEK